MLHKIREVFGDENDLHDDNQGNDGKLANNVEIDESFIGVKTKTVTEIRKLKNARDAVSKTKFLYLVCWREASV